MENGIFVVGKLQGTGNSIFDVNSSSGSFLRLNPLGMLLMKNTNNANRYQIGIRNNGELCFGNNTSTTSGTMGGSFDKFKIKQTGEVEVKYNLKVGDANGALLTEIIFSYPGQGYLLLQAVRAQDFPLLQGIFLTITFSVLLSNLIVDIVLLLLDPRIRK